MKLFYYQFSILRGGSCNTNDCCNPFSVYTFGGTWFSSDSASIMITNEKLNLKYMCPNQELKMGWDMSSPIVLTSKENENFFIDEKSFSIKDSKKP